MEVMTKCKNVLKLSEGDKKVLSAYSAITDDQKKVRITPEASSKECLHKEV